MRVTQVEYSRLMSDGDFGHVKVGVVVEVGEDESANDALKRAKDYVDRQVKAATLSPWAIERARDIVKRADKHGVEILGYDGEAELKAAKETLAIPELAELPF